MKILHQAERLLIAIDFAMLYTPLILLCVCRRLLKDLVSVLLVIINGHFIRQPADIFLENASANTACLAINFQVNVIVAVSFIRSFEQLVYYWLEQELKGTQTLVFDLYMQAL